MKSVSSLLTLTYAAAVTAESITLTTESSNAATNDKGLSNIHEGAGINGVYLSDDKSTVYNLNAGNISIAEGGPYPYFLNEEFNTLVFTAGGPFGVPTGVNDGYLTVNGSNSVFYACKPGVPLDPYGYSKDGYGVAIFGEGESKPDTCEPLKIKVGTAGSGLQNATTTSAAPTTSAGKTFSPLYNATVTAGTTKYTTIVCPMPTTLAYGNSTYTVSSATTLTVEDCGCTAPGSSVAPTVAKPTKSAAPTINGAISVNANAIGGAFVAAAALLI